MPRRWKLPRRQPAALQHGAGLVDPDGGVLTGLMGGPNHPQGGAVADAGQRPGIAVSQDATAVGEQLRSYRADPPVAPDVLGGHRQGFL